MTITFAKQKPSDDQAKLRAIDRALAVIEFDLSGHILAANQNFLTTLGYSIEEIRGKHHSMFVDSSERDGREYREFWDKLRRGELLKAQFRRVAKGGRDIWIEASYNPLFDKDNKPYKVVKYATDITQSRAELADLRGQSDAIRKSQAVIEFSLDGIVLTANSNFLTALGYSLQEIQGQHHRMFVERSAQNSPEYFAFWQNLRQGQFQAGQFKRIGKGGRDIWIEASYNPIFDAYGKPAKVVKFATDITKQVEVMNDLRRIIDTNFSEIDKAIGQLRTTSEATAQATAETSTSVNAVAAASEELSASIAEISQRMTQSKTASDEAFNNTGEADDATRKLTRSAEAMSGIVQLIQEIASQINLLALNATIESARAGEAGRGFAVVASEVKQLASQAADATRRIATEIEGVQGVSLEVAGALTRVKQSIDSLREFVSATAAAVEEQSAVTQDVSSNMSGASSAVASIDGNMVSVAAAIHQAASAIEETREAARVLAR